MLERLSASREPGRLEPGRVLLAAALHGAVISGAIKATAPHAAPPASRDLRVVDMTLNPAEPDPAPASASAEPEGIAAAPQLEELIAPPAEVPVAIPPIKQGPMLDLSRFRAINPGPTAAPAGTPGMESRIIAAGEADD